MDLDAAGTRESHRMNSLTVKQERFCLEYLRTGNATEAYRLSYNVKNMKSATINRTAFDMLKHRKISARLKELNGNAASLAELNASEVMLEIKRIALSDISGIMHEDGRVKLPIELDPATRAAVASFKMDEYGRVEYRFWDKNAALEKAAKILGLFEKGNVQKAGGFLADLPRELVQLMVDRLRQLKATG
jgi:phage terminase small subunit